MTCSAQHANEARVRHQLDTDHAYQDDSNRAKGCRCAGAVLSLRGSNEGQGVWRVIASRQPTVPVSGGCGF